MPGFLFKFSFTFLNSSHTDWKGKTLACLKEHCPLINLLSQKESCHNDLTFLHLNRFRQMNWCKMIRFICSDLSKNQLSVQPASLMCEIFWNTFCANTKLVHYLDCMLWCSTITGLLSHRHIGSNSELSSSQMMWSSTYFYETDVEVLLLEPKLKQSLKGARRRKKKKKKPSSNYHWHDKGVRDKKQSERRKRSH